MFRSCVLFMVAITCNSCAEHNTGSTSISSTVNIDSIKNSVEEKFNATLVTLDSAIGASHNTLADSIRIQQLRDSANRLYMLLDSLGVKE